MFCCIPFLFGGSSRIQPVQNSTCAICLDDVVHGAINALNNDVEACSNRIPHYFHRACIEDYRVHRWPEVASCPTCRSVFDRVVRGEGNVLARAVEAAVVGAYESGSLSNANYEPMVQDLDDWIPLEDVQDRGGRVVVREEGRSNSRRLSRYVLSIEP